MRRASPLSRGFVALLLLGGTAAGTPSTGTRPPGTSGTMEPYCESAFVDAAPSSVSPRDSLRSLVLSARDRDDAGHAASRSELARRVYDMAMGMLRARVPNHYDREDAAQDAVMAVMASLPGYREEAGSASTWIGSIILRRGIDRARREGNAALRGGRGRGGDPDEEGPPAVAPESRPSEAAEAAARVDSLRALVAADLLRRGDPARQVGETEPQRTDRQLRFRVLRDYPETATAMGRTEREVRTLVERATYHLERALQP